MHGIDTRKSVIPCDVVNPLEVAMKFIHFYIGLVWFITSIVFDREKLKSDIGDKWISEGAFL